MPRKSIIAVLVDPYIFNPLHKVSILEDYNPSKTVGVARGHQRADTLKP